MVQQATVRPVVLAWLQEGHDGTARCLAEDLGLRYSSVYRALQHLEKSGHVRITEVIACEWTKNKESHVYAATDITGPVAELADMPERRHLPVGAWEIAAPCAMLAPASWCGMLQA